MTRLFLAAGVAALALSVPASAKPGGGNGHGGGGEHAQFHGGGDRGGGEQRMQVQGFGQQGGRQAFRAQRDDRGGGRAFQVQRFERRDGKRMQGLAGLERGEHRRHEAREERREAREFHAERFEHGGSREMARRDRGDRHELREMAREQLRIDRSRGPAFVHNDDLERFGGFDRDDHWSNAKGRGLVEGCPPGLWKKANGCLPPGQARKLVGAPLATVSQLAALSSLPIGIRSLYPDTDNYYYRYGDGYLYRIDRNRDLVDSVLPLLAAGLLPGQPFPAAYMNSYVPDYYGFDAFYPDNPYVDYRYMGGNIYGIDPSSGLIENVVPLYGYGYGVGQMLPSGYGYYNVPYQYRDLYAPASDYSYWYAPGAIYQVDPTSRLITAVASLLSPGLSIGQPLPTGYDYYNVPMAYRDTYYDSPTAWYRYSNGYIYQVDPTTRLVTAIVASLLT